MVIPHLLASRIETQESTPFKFNLFK